MFPFKGLLLFDSYRGVYRIVHKPTDSSYVGTSINLRSRIGDHRQTLRAGMHRCRRLQQLWDNSTLEDFAVEILEECDSDDETLAAAENDWKIKMGESLLNPGRVTRKTSLCARPISLNMKQRSAFDICLDSFSDPNKCWDWPGRRDRGYGIFRGWRAHRVSYFFHYGVDPDNNVVRHTCDNSMCVNPAHLVLGTQNDNVRDRVERCRSQRNLTPELVFHIRQRHLSGARACDLSRMYGVNLDSILRNRSFHDPNYIPPKVIRIGSNNIRMLPDEITSKIQLMSMSGMSSRQICRNLGLAYPKVCNVLTPKDDDSLMGAACDLSQDDLDRFWGKVIKTDTCWLWSSPNGRFTLVGHQESARRVSFAIKYGRWPASDVLVKRACDNSSCVNPEHLVLKPHYYLGSEETTIKTNIGWGQVKEIRQLAVETNMTLREIGKLFGFSDTNVRHIVNNTSREFYDPDYIPPQRRTGPRSQLVTIYGEEKTLREWADDSRCQVSYDTLRHRYRDGKKGADLLISKHPAGRPVRPVSGIHKELMRRRAELIVELDAQGLSYKEINGVLSEHGWKKTGNKEISSLTEDIVIPAERLEKLRETSLHSEWTCRAKAKELGLPLSVVLRYRETKAA